MHMQSSPRTLHPHLIPIITYPPSPPTKNRLKAPKDCQSRAFPIQTNFYGKKSNQLPLQNVIEPPFPTLRITSPLNQLDPTTSSFDAHSFHHLDTIADHNKTYIKTNWTFHTSMPTGRTMKWIRGQHSPSTFHISCTSKRCYITI